MLSISVSERRDIEKRWHNQSYFRWVLLIQKLGVKVGVKMIKEVLWTYVENGQYC